MNTQPIEKLDRTDDGTLDVVQVWYTIQGEGPFAGRPATFIRTAGCNLICPACDTDYTSKRHRISHTDLLQAIAMSSPSGLTDLVVITGGEPFRQRIGPFVELLHERRYDVQIETNGTFFPEDFPYIHATIVCSPKTPEIKVNKWAVDYWKYVLESGHVDPDDGLPTRTLGGLRPARPNRSRRDNVFLQPLDSGEPEKNKRNMEATVASCLRFGYRLSVQLHKLAGLE